MFVLLIICLLTPRITECASTAFNQPYQQSPAGVQKEVDREKLKLQAQELADAIIKGDYARAADLTYPKLVRLMGGRTKFIAAFEREMRETTSEQFRLSSITVGEPLDIVNVNRQYYAIVPQTMRIKVPEGMLVGDAFMFGISSDGGQNWTFIDSGKASNKEQLRMLIGPAADQLRMMEVKRPVLYRDPKE